MEDINSEHANSNKKPENPTHEVSKSSSKSFINNIIKIYIFLLI